MELISRFFDPPSQSYFLFGPRGTGKSTWLKQHYPDAAWINLASPDEYRDFSARPERLRELLDARKPTDSRVVVIDEVQKLPEILGLVHVLIEKKQGWQFIMTGSSSRKLKRSGVDLLAGRALLCTFHPFLAAELKDAFNLEQMLQKGCLPLVLDSANPLQTLSTYIGIYMNEEVKAEGIVRNISGFSRFLEAISFSHCSLLNVSSVARECQVGQKTVEGFVSVLEDLLLCFRLPVFSRRAGRALIRHAKFYYFDAGVFRSIRPKGPMDNPEQIAGTALEGLVAQHLRAWIALGSRRLDMYFWRTRSGNEVDFIVYGEETFAAIEVKNAAKVRPEDLRGLLAFRADFPESIPVLLYRGRARMKVKGVLCIPVEEFLMALKPGERMTALIS